MNPFALAFVVIVGTALLAVPRKWAPVALLVGVCYMTMGQGIEIGPFSLPVYRMLLALGVLRVLTRREWLTGKLNGVDIMMICWVAWRIFSSLYHVPKYGPVYASGVAFNVALAYFLVRIWCQRLSDVTDVVKAVGIMLVPVAIEMLQEKVTGKNLFSVFGVVYENVIERRGKLRAQGPFAHPILAGTVGAALFPLMIAIWREHRAAATIGMIACLSMIFACASSGPVMSFLAAMFAVGMWKLRHLTKAMRIMAVLLYIALDITMTRPAYYLISKIDISGGSTGWHRSRLIQSAFRYFDEWWLFGTDRTRHWMPTGLPGVPEHTDITNYYLAFAVGGGLLSMLLMIGMLLLSFKFVGKIIRMYPDAPNAQFKIWCIGSGLFSHAVTSISVAYFDQSLVFFWLNVAIISTFYSLAKYHRDRPNAEPRRQQARMQPNQPYRVPGPVPTR